ncbi:MAG: cellulase family glycosylhydrolase [Armatimonadetes bacterium]|nr:cellulase family glycosylhydrolase [Armatimonadota bacterium]
MTKQAMWVGLATAVSMTSIFSAPAKPFDAFEGWKAGAFRGANVLPPKNTPDDLKALRSWGANLAEIAVIDVFDPRPPYGPREDAIKLLDRAVDSAERSDLFVALTCRTGPGRADFNTSPEIWADKEAQDAYIRMWAHLANRYRGRRAMVGYDLMCEPHPEEPYIPVWNELAKRITAAIREVDPKTPILINSAGWAYPAPFDKLEPTGDKRTVYAVHFYYPHYYTHQKPENNRAYPGFRNPDDPDTPWDKNVIERHLEPVLRFQKKHRVPIFVGEFGCARFAPGAERFFKDQIDLYESRRWSWAYWAFREWDAMDIEKTADPADKNRYPDTPLLSLFKSYFARDRRFPSGEADKP